jgi:hypothetical protein
MTYADISTPSRVEADLKYIQPLTPRQWETASSYVSQFIKPPIHLRL